MRWSRGKEGQDFDNRKNVLLFYQPKITNVPFYGHRWNTPFVVSGHGSKKKKKNEEGGTFIFTLHLFSEQEIKNTAVSRV